MVFNADFVSEIINTKLPEALVNEPAVKFLLCDNYLKVRNIDSDSLPERFEIVPAAIIYIIQQQAPGAYYIRP